MQRIDRWGLRIAGLIAVGWLVSGFVGASLTTGVMSVSPRHILELWARVQSGNLELGYLSLDPLDMKGCLGHWGSTWVGFSALRWGLWGAEGLDGNSGVHSVVIPLWCLAVPPLVAAGALRMTRRAPTGACGACGYDLTGLYGRACPECGTLEDV